MVMSDCVIMSIGLVISAGVSVYASAATVPGLAGNSD